MIVRKCFSCGLTLMSEALPRDWREQTLYEFDAQQPEKTVQETRYACSDACADKVYPGWLKPVPSAPTTVEG